MAPRPRRLSPLFEALVLTGRQPSTDQPAGGPLSAGADAAAGRLRRRCGDRGRTAGRVGACRAGRGPASDRRQSMSLEAAQRYAWSLACSLKVIIVIIATDDGYYVMTSADYDGDPDAIIREYDEIGRAHV